MAKPQKRLEKNLERSRRVIKWAFFIVVLLALAKGIVGLFSGSVGLLAQAVDSFTDLLSASTVYLGLWLAQRPANEEYPYGYFKAETMAALLVAIFIFISGLAVLWEAILHILAPMPLQFYDIALAVTIISIPVISIKSWYLQRVGRETGSEAVISTGKNYQMDIYASLVVLTGLVFEWLGVGWAEAIVGFFIGLVILKGSLEIAHDSVLTLMDAIRNPEMIDGIRELALPVRGVQGVHNVKLRRAGPICFGEMHLNVAGDITVAQGHHLTEEIERRIKNAYPEVLAFLVHVEPAQMNEFRIGFAVTSKSASKDSFPSPHFGSSPYFLLLDVKNEEIVQSQIIKNPAAFQERKRGITTAKTLIEHEVDAVLAMNIGEAPLSILRNALVDVHLADANRTIGENIKAFHKDQLPHLVASSKSGHRETKGGKS